MYSHGGFRRSSSCTLQFTSAELLPLHNFQKRDCRCRWAYSFGIGEVWWLPHTIGNKPNLYCQAIAFVLPSWSFLSLLVINCMHPFLVLSGASEATLSQWGNIHKLYRLYIFLRERHQFVLYVPNGKATNWHKTYSFIAVDQQTKKYCL